MNSIHATTTPDELMVEEPATSLVTETDEALDPPAYVYKSKLTEFLWTLPQPLIALSSMCAVAFAITSESMSPTPRRAHGGGGEDARGDARVRARGRRGRSRHEDRRIERRSRRRR